MKIPYLKITGWGGAIRSMYMTNKNYTEELEAKIRKCEEAYNAYNTTDSYMPFDSNLQVRFENTNTVMSETLYADDAKWFENEINKVIKIGRHHITLLRYVDVEWIVDGLHRGAQDDFDSHAERFDNRIVRMSTRTNNDGKLAEISDWYKGKILTFQDLSDIFNMPEEIEKDGVIYTRTPFGYIQKDVIGTPIERDVRRGLVPLAVSSTFIVKCQITELCHVYRERNRNGNAAPELKDMIEMVVERISKEVPALNSEFFLTQCTQ